MNGSGSRDVVYIDASGSVTYVELFPEHPNLMRQIDNGIGKVIQMSYASSVEHMGRDGGPDAWTYRLPHPMQVLDRLVTFDTLSGVQEIQRMHYRDGYYDGAEQQFRGFGETEVFAEGDESMEDGRSVQHFDLGVTDRYRYGLLLDKHVESAGRVLSTVAYTYSDCALSQIATVGVTHPIRWLCQDRKLSVVQEGQGSNEWVTIEERYVHDGYGNRTETHRLGVTQVGNGSCEPCDARDPSLEGRPCGPTCVGDELHTIARHIEPGSGTSGRWILRAEYQSIEYGTSLGVATDRRTYYDGPSFLGLEWQTLNRGAVQRVEVREDVGSGAVHSNEALRA